MEKLIENISKNFETIKIDNNFVEIKTNLEFKKSFPVRVFLKKVDDKFYISDNKNTLRYMNTIYNLSSKDVIQCINDIVNHYRFKIDKGEILGEINAENAKRRFLDFIVCCQSLANMFIFFDDPN